MSVAVLFIKILVPMAATVVGLKLTSDTIQNLTGNNLVEAIIEGIPNAIKFIQSCFDIFRTYFELLPPHVKSIFFVFLSVMSVIILIKFVKGSD